MDDCEVDTQPGAVIHITVVPIGYQISSWVEEDNPTDHPHEPSASVCRDFSGNVNTTAMIVALFDELATKFQDSKWVAKFEKE
jgi:hypothetical protein